MVANAFAFKELQDLHCGKLHWLTQLSVSDSEFLYTDRRSVHFASNGMCKILSPRYHTTKKVNHTISTQI